MLKDNQFLTVRIGSPDQSDSLHRRLQFQLNELNSSEQGLFKVTSEIWSHAFTDYPAGPEWLLFMVMLDLQQQMHWAIYKHFNLPKEGQDGKEQKGS